MIALLKALGILTIPQVNFKTVDEVLTGDKAGLGTLHAELQHGGFPQDDISILHLLSALIRWGLVRTADLRTRPFQLGAINPVVVNALKEPLAGTEIASLLFGWKNSLNPDDRRRYLSLQDRFSKLVPGYSFDVVNVPPEAASQPRGNSPNQGAAVVIQNDDYWVRLDYASAGIFEVLVTLTAIALADGKVVLLGLTTHLMCVYRQDC